MGKKEQVPARVRSLCRVLCGSGCGRRLAGVVRVKESSYAHEHLEHDERFLSLGLLSETGGDRDMQMWAAGRGVLSRASWWPTRCARFPECCVCLQPRTVAVRAAEGGKRLASCEHGERTVVRPTALPPPPPSLCLCISSRPARISLCVMMPLRTIRHTQRPSLILNPRRISTRVV